MPSLASTTAKGPYGNFFYEFNHYALGGVMGHKHCLCLCPPLRLRGRTGVFRRREGYLLATLLRVSPSASSSCSVGHVYEAYPHAEVRRLRILLRKGPLSLLPHELVLRLQRLFAVGTSSGAVGRVSGLR